MLWLLVYSSVTFLLVGHVQPLHWRHAPYTTKSLSTKLITPATCDLPELALPQLVLALAATTIFHVQIINRIASGYPMWYVTVATWLTHNPSNPQAGSQSNVGQWAVRAMIMYSMIQGILFANFLPPA